IKRELIVTRIAQRLALREETVWGRLKELREQAQAREQKHPGRVSLEEEEPGARSAPAAPEERELLEVLLADPGLVPQAAALVKPQHIQHPGLRALLEGLYGLHAEGDPPTLD